VNANPAVFAADPQNFQTEVIERSNQMPVIVLFWAEQMPETLGVRQLLDTQVTARADKLALALVDVGADQSLAQHLRVQTLPSIRVVQGGQLAEQLDGPQPDEALIALCDRLTLSSADVLREQLAGCLAAEDFDAALALLQRAIDEEPQNTAFRVELADVLVMQGNLSDAKTVLAGIAEDTQDLPRPVARLAFAEESAEMDSLDVLERNSADDSSNLDTQYCLAVRYAQQNRLEEALETALGILCTDRKFKNDIGRLTMLKIFDLLPKGDELASSFRRRMFNFMH